jgi:spore coat protein CotH
MIEGRHINIAAVAIAAAALIFAVIFTYFQSILPVATFSPISEKQYESKLFKKDSLLKVDIIISEDNWNDLVANAVNEEYYLCDVKINGETFANVGIRVKGNNSVTEISEAGSDRYSLKIEFDHYVSGMSCYGLDKLVLNNCYSDVTYMKEYLAYDMFAFLGADASLYSFASVSVNGENRGLYLALESVEESFAERNYGSNYGELYKSADWVYIDDKISSYDTIWDSALFKSGKNDYKRVITALKKISEGEDPDKYIDVDAVLKYLAVNTFVANLDSSGNMSYSNYMYENNGLLSIIPWHYNTAFGGLQSGDAASVINYPIDIF